MAQVVQTTIGTPTPVTEADKKAQADFQKDLLERVTGHRDTGELRTAALMTNTKLTTKEHVGKGNEPHKPDEQESLKVGSAQNAVALRSIEISTHESGEPTDTVVTEPSTVEAAANPLMHRDDAIGTARLIAQERGDEEPKSMMAKVVGKGPAREAAKSAESDVSEPEKENAHPKRKR
jgi:hypothetical protein